MNKNIYGTGLTENVVIPSLTTVLHEDNVPIKSAPDPIVYIDCDKNFTLMDQIQAIRQLNDLIPDDKTVNIYVVKGTFDKKNFLWYKLWQYLKETGRQYNIVFRGIFPDGAETVSTYGENIKVYISKDIEYRQPPWVRIQDLFKNFGYNFTEI